MLDQLIRHSAWRSQYRHDPGDLFGASMMKVAPDSPSTILEVLKPGAVKIPVLSHHRVEPSITDIKCAVALLVSFIGYPFAQLGSFR